MDTSRGFLFITYKLYHHLNKLDGEHKSHCLNVFLSVMKYAWKKNGYEARLRHETIHKEKARASKMVLLPAPFVLTIKFVLASSKLISLYTLPVERKFFQRIFSKTIILQGRQVVLVNRQV